MLIGKHHDITAFASSDPTRYAICGVHYNAKHQRLEAVDGVVAIHVPVCDRSEEFPSVKTGDAALKDCIIPTPAFKRALANAKDSGKSNSLPVLSYARLSANGDNRATFTTTDLDTEQAVTAKCVDATFPNLDQVWPDKAPVLSIVLSSSILKRIAEYAEKHGVDTDGKGAGIRFDFIDSLSPVRFSIHLDDSLGEKPKAEGIAMPMRMS